MKDVISIRKELFVFIASQYTYIYDVCSLRVCNNNNKKKLQ